MMISQSESISVVNYESKHRHMWDTGAVSYWAHISWTAKLVASYLSIFSRYSHIGFHITHVYQIAKIIID